MPCASASTFSPSPPYVFLGRISHDQHGARKRRCNSADLVSLGPTASRVIRVPALYFTIYLQFSVSSRLTAITIVFSPRCGCAWPSSTTKLPNYTRAVCRRLYLISKQTDCVRTHSCRTRKPVRTWNVNTVNITLVFFFF